MTVQTHALGGRLPLADPDSLTVAQRQVFDALMATLIPWSNSVPFQSTTEDGRLIGPFNPALYSPAISSKFLELQVFEETHTSLPERLRQVVTLAVGAVWGADYELYAHSAAARKAGISEDAIATLVSGGIPEDLTKDEKTAGRVAQQLCRNHRIDDALYRDAETALGTLGLVDLGALIGVYHGVCTTLTLFEVPAPAQGARQ